MTDMTLADEVAFLHGISNQTKPTKLCVPKRHDPDPCMTLLQKILYVVVEGNSFSLLINSLGFWLSHLPVKLESLVIAHRVVMNQTVRVGHAHGYYLKKKWE